MKKNNKIILVILAVLAAVFAFLIFNKKVQTNKNSQNANSPNNPSPDGTNKNTGTSSTPTSPSTPQPSIFPIKNGSRGDHVIELQKALNYMYFTVLKQKTLAKLDNDGIFGAKTEEMLEKIYGVKQVDKEIAKTILENVRSIIPKFLIEYL